MELLVLLIFFHLILDINSQYVPQPQLSVSPEVITLRGSVQLHCLVPNHLKVYQCFFYPETQKTNIKLSPSCQLSVTGSELITWTGHRSPGTLRIICYYTVDKSVHVPSPHSLPAPVTVTYQKPILSVVYDDQTDDIRLTCEIPESVTADISCNLYTGENPQPYLKVQRYEKKTSRRLFCVFTAQRNDVFNVLQSVKSSEVSCDYSLISDSTVRSLMSDKYNLMPFFPTPTQTSTTETSTAG
ncbi:mucin-3A-like [Tachysurus ichikawai]